MNMFSFLKVFVCTPPFFWLIKDLSSCGFQHFPTTVYLRERGEAAMEDALKHELPEPWDHESPMTRELFVDGSCNGKTRFHCIDPWHCIHLGVGKTWVAAGVMLLSELLEESTIEQRIAVLGREYKQFCKRQKLDPYLRKIDVHTFNSTTDPIGTWSKAGVTSNWMLFLQEYCETHADKIRPDPRLRNFAPHLHLHVSPIVICF